MTEAEVKTLLARAKAAALADGALVAWHVLYAKHVLALANEVRRLRAALTAIERQPSDSYRGSSEFNRGSRDAYQVSASVARRALQPVAAVEAGDD